MLTTFERKLAAYLEIASISPKIYLVYSSWAWVELIVQIMAMIIFVYFWRAIYSNLGPGATLNGLDLQQMLNYVLLAQVIVPITKEVLVNRFGRMYRDGSLVMELIRPVDFEASFYMRSLSNVLFALVLKTPLLIMASLFFGLVLPVQLSAWLCFVISLLLGHAIMFLFDWSLACLAFYTTETWGLQVARDSLVNLLSGFLIPLPILPAWLGALANALPFAQAVYVPLSFLSGITPVAQAPQIWLQQLVWLLALGVLSRVMFSLASRKITVQGG